MAGNAKPNDTILIGSKKEMKDYEVLNYYSANSSLNSNYTPTKLFNGTITSTASAYDYFSWNVNEEYPDAWLTLKVNKACNLYRHPRPDMLNQINTLTVESEDMDFEKYISSHDLSQGNKWELFLELKKPGIYKLSNKWPGMSKPRTDSEWFIELNDLVLLKSNGNYYSIKEEFYNADTKSYNPIETIDFPIQSFHLSALFQEITIGEDTFKPIDKFDKFQIVQYDNNLINVLGRKTHSELIAANDDIDLTIADAIKSFTLLSNQTECAVKMAMSVNKGDTWNTYSDGKLIPLNITIPQKRYSSMSDIEKSQWENAKNEVLENGIDVSILNAIAFKDLLKDQETIRFAYAIELKSENSIAEIDKLSWSFNATGRMYKMNDNEVTVDIYEHKVLVTPQINNQLIKTNIVF